MGNIANIASCRCNRQQDNSEMDLNKDKQELLKSQENSHRDDKNFKASEYQNQIIDKDKIKFGEVGFQNKNEHESIVTPANENFSKARESEKCNFIYCSTLIVDLSIK